MNAFGIIPAGKAIQTLSINCMPDPRIRFCQVRDGATVRAGTVEPFDEDSYLGLCVPTMGLTVACRGIHKYRLVDPSAESIP